MMPLRHPIVGEPLTYTPAQGPRDTEALVRQHLPLVRRIAWHVHGAMSSIVEVEDLEIHETRVEILDSYNEMKLVALIEVVSPTNKAAGPGRVVAVHSVRMAERDRDRYGSASIAARE